MHRKNEEKKKKKRGKGRKEEEGKKQLCRSLFDGNLSSTHRSPRFRRTIGGRRSVTSILCCSALMVCFSFVVLFPSGNSAEEEGSRKVVKGRKSTLFQPVSRGINDLEWSEGSSMIEK